MAFYGRKEYWDERYTRYVFHDSPELLILRDVFDPFDILLTNHSRALPLPRCSLNSATEPYEWYQSYHGICHLLTPFHLTASHGVDPANPRRIVETFGSPSRQGDVQPLSSHHQRHQQALIPCRKDCRVLVVGCGNSRLADDMVRDGWTGGIVGVDWSPVVIGQMEAKYTPEYLGRMVMDEAKRHGRDASDDAHSFPLMEFLCANVLEGLPFDDGSFDLILCKGSFDAMVSSSASNARLLNQECFRLLHPGHGSMVIITHGNPESRIVFFENPQDEWWSEVGIHTIAKPTMDRRHLIENHDGTK